MPSDAVNLYDIYAKFLSRKGSGSIELGVRAAAHRAAEIAKQVLDAPTPENVRAIKAAEAAWMRLARGSRVSYAKEFAAAIGSGNFYVKRRGVNSAWGTYQPEEGYIYGASSRDRPGWMKLGATTESPLVRIEQFRKRHGLKEVTLMYFAKVAKPFSIENEIRKCLKIYNRHESLADSREWFAVTPQHAMQTAIDAIARLDVKVFIPVKASKQMELRNAPRAKVPEWINHGGRLATTDRLIADPMQNIAGDQTIETKVAQSRSGFAIGNTVHHNNQQGKFGLGVITSVNLEEVVVYFQRVDRAIPIPLCRAGEFIRLQTNTAQPKSDLRA
jgi:hypothetical protein